MDGFVLHKMWSSSLPGGSAEREYFTLNDNNNNKDIDDVVIIVCLIQYVCIQSCSCTTTTTTTTTTLSLSAVSNVFSSLSVMIDGSHCTCIKDMTN